MSISLRRHRAVIYSYRDAGTTGQMNSNYLRVSSGDADHAFWCSKVQPSGNEETVGSKAEHRVDAVFGFAAAVTITENGAIVCDSVEYLVRAILDRDYGRDEVLVEAERAAFALTLVTV